jgi:hypothetical protein
MNRTTFAASSAVLLLVSSLVAASPPDAGWDAVDRVFGQPGKDLPENVHKFSWPRTDLKVSIDGVAVEPALALGSWGAFQKMEGGSADTMGDLVLLGSEVAPVVSALEGGGFEVMAIHNHLINEIPRVVYVHFHGKGEPAALAETLRGALARSATPLTPGTGAAPAKPTVEQEKAFQAVQDIVGRKGSLAGRVLQMSIPRGEKITDLGMEIPPAMGMAIAINFETVGPRVATTGDFVLVADEVNPVIRALHAHGIEATALHSHMLRESPRLFFLHFWGVDTPEKIAAGIQDALSKVAIP